MKKLNTNGFSPVAVLLIVVVLGVIGGIGYYVYSTHQKTDTATAQKNVVKAQVAQQKKSTELKLTTKPYIDPGTGVKQYYPENWVQDKSSVTALGFNNPSADKTSDGQEFNAYLTADIQSTGGLSESEYVQKITDQRAKLPNYTLVSTRKLTSNDGVPFTLLEEKYTDGNMLVHGYKGIAVQSGVAVIITTVSLDNVWSKYESVFMQSLVK